jgi:hypothetical protein
LIRKFAQRAQVAAVAGKVPLRDQEPADGEAITEKPASDKLAISVARDACSAVKSGLLLVFSFAISPPASGLSLF